MSHPMTLDRRAALAAAAIAASQLARHAVAPLHAQEPSAESPRPIAVGMMGLARGKELTADLLKMPGVEIRYACDTDRQRVEAGAKLIGEAGGQATAIQDFRRMLDDSTLDAIFCAAPNHWHGPATILACHAGKHVYVEKPACHNPQEGEWMVAAATAAKRCVQVGNQRRSSPGFREAISRLHAGAIGRVYLARAFFQRQRGSIGRGQDSPAPPHLDYELWQGPAPRRPFRDNVVHYNWHWFWHWGNGELGNNGVHCLDVCRWGLQVDCPVKTVSSGGRFCYEDDQQTPDTHSAEWLFEGGKQITYQGLSCTTHAPGPFASFYGSEGAMEIDGDGGFKIFDASHKLVEEKAKTGWGQVEHLANFIAAVRADDPGLLNQPILSGHQSTLLCHLGNMAYRADQTIRSASGDGRPTDAAIAQAYWGRDYDPAWQKLIEASL